MIKCNNKKKILWALGLVTVCPGQDKCIRVVTVKTANGDMTRPEQNSYSLEISFSDKLCKRADVTKTETGAPRIVAMK